MTRKMHIIVISTSFPSAELSTGQEAAGSFVADFVHHLSGEADVTVIAPGMEPLDEQRNGVRLRLFPVPRLSLSLLHPGNPMHWRSIMLTLIRGSAAVRKIVKSRPTDHILALWALPSGYWAMNSSKENAPPFSTWALGSDIWSLGRLPLIRRILRVVLRSADHRFADGYQLADDVTRISGKQCQFLPSSRTLKYQETRKPSSNPPYRLAFLGRWHPNKGTDILLDALHLMTADDWDKIEEIRIFGGGPLAPEVEEGSRQLKAAGRPVIIGGYLAQSDAIALYSWADYILIPSRIESIPVVFSDALQLHRPVIAMPVGDLPRLIGNHKTGVLATDVSPTGFATAIRSACSINPNGFIEAIDRLAMEFNTATAVKQFLQCIQSSSKRAP